MNKKRIYLILVVILLLVLVGGFIGIYQRFTPANLSQKVFSLYQRKYPDLKFSLQSLKRKFEKQLVVEGENLVISKHGKPIASISGFSLKARYFDFFKDESIAQISLGQVQIFESKNIFIENELDRLFESLIDIKPLNVSWNRLELEGSFLLGSGKASTSINQILEKELIVDTRVESISSYELKDVALRLNASLEQWRRNKELRFEGEASKDKQSVIFKSLLKSNGSFQTHFTAKGRLLNGETQLDINRKKISLKDSNLYLSLDSIDRNLSGQLNISGDWISNLESHEIQSTMIFVGEKSAWKKSPIQIEGQIADDIKTKVRLLESVDRISTESTLSLDLSNLELSLFVALGNKKTNRQRRRFQPQDIVSSVFNFSEQKMMNVLAQIYYENYVMGQKIKNAQMTIAVDEIRGKKISFNLNFSDKSFLNGHYHRHTDVLTPIRCMVNFDNSPSTVLNNFLPRDHFQFIKGSFSGSARCRDEKNFNLQIDSKELEISFIPFNKELKRFVGSSRIYKDHLYSKVNLSIKDKQLDELKLSNRKYDVNYSQKKTASILEVLGMKLQYDITSENQYRFNKRL